MSKKYKNDSFREHKNRSVDKNFFNFIKNSRHFFHRKKP